MNVILWKNLLLSGSFATLRMTGVRGGDVVLWRNTILSGSFAALRMTGVQDDRGAGRIAPAPLARKVSLKIDCIGGRQRC